jgi:hypothetical protein
VDIWSKSPERERAIAELEELNRISQAYPSEEDTASFATSKWYQFHMVLRRLMIKLYREPVRTYAWGPMEYILTLIGLHVEQDHSAHLRCSVLGIYFLEDGQWNV